MFKSEHKKLTFAEDQVLGKGFCLGYAKYCENIEVKNALLSVKSYRRSLKNVGMSDHELINIKKDYWEDLILYSKYLTLISFYSVVALPGLVFNIPVGFLMRYLAEKERIKCLKASSVKVLGKDVVTSYKLILGFVILPIYWAV